MSGRVRIGISGWRYAPWRGGFYPPGLPQARELAYAAARLATIELNGSFYALQRPSSFESWSAQTPDDFVFSVKGGRFITHMKRLREVEVPLANFFASGVLALGPKLGPVLWQLPPTMPFEAEPLAAFLRLLPATTGAAAELAGRHDERLEGRALTTTDADRPMRHAFEVRHPSFANRAFIELLREHGMALVVADSARRFPYLDDVTADFAYARLHGDEELYVSGYDDTALDTWASRVAAWRDGAVPVSEHTVAAPAAARAEGRDVFVYFDNDVKVRAPYDAMGLARRLGVGPPEPPPEPLAPPRRRPARKATGPSAAKKAVAEKTATPATKKTSTARKAAAEGGISRSRDRS
jgi:uncharacterized protein YecE (DUF72 family)